MILLIASCALAAAVLGSAWIRWLLARLVRSRCAPQPDRAPSHRRLVRLRNLCLARWHHRTRRRRCRAAALAGVLDDTARRCSSGTSLTAAFLTAHESAADEVAADFDIAVTALHAGAGLHDALAQVHCRDPDVALATHVLRLCSAQGGSISEPLDRAAATLRERQAVHDERIAQAGQARLSAQVLTVVPMAFATWTAVTTASVRRFISSPPGIVSTAVGLALNLIGWTLMRRAIEVRR